jgi:hypothetical protein
MVNTAGVLLLVGLLIACTGRGRATDDTITKSRLDGLADAFRNRKVAAVEVLHIPAEILFRSAVTPEILEQLWQDKLTVRIIDDALAGQLTSALSNVVVRSAPGRWDVRWGFIFLSSQGQRVVTIYFDGRRDGAVIDGRYVSFEGGLVSKLKAALLKQLD